MRFKFYLTEANYKSKGRGKFISEEQALKIAPKFSQAIIAALNENYYLIRYRESGKKVHFYHIDPKKSKEPRKSANTSNYYTLIMDNSRKWSKYPKRSQSLICSIDKNINNIWAATYLVLPKNGAKIGECSGPDLWVSFPNVGASTPMNDWSIGVSFLLSMPEYTDEEIESKFFRGLDYDSSLNEFKEACKRFDYWVKNTTELTIKEIQNALIFRFSDSIWIRKWKGEPIYKFFDELLDPKKNQFKLVNIFSLSKYNSEAWTDAESLMILGAYNPKSFLEYAKQLIQGKK